MYEILIVKPVFYHRGDGVSGKILDWDTPDRLWWFEEPYTHARLKAVLVPDGADFAFPCEAVQFSFDFCPNPSAWHFNVSALHSELIEGRMLRELLEVDVLKFAEVVKKKRRSAPEGWRAIDELMNNFYALYKVKTWDNRDDDGGLDSIDVEMELVGEIDLERLPEIIVGEKYDTNDPPNAKHWKKDDLVIHDGDAKEARMLMRVIGYTRDGLVKTQYVDQKRTRKIWVNESRYLHDPFRFGIRTNLPELVLAQ